MSSFEEQLMEALGSTAEPVNPTVGVEVDAAAASLVERGVDLGFTVDPVNPAITQFEVRFKKTVLSFLHSFLLKVDAAVASLVEGGLPGGIQVEVVEQQVEKADVSAAGDEQGLDTEALAQRVRHYLKANQIQWTRFGALVLGVSQGRLSILLGKPKPWHQLAPRVRALYQRMQLWMDTKATFGNNPYMKVKKEKAVVKPKVERVPKAKKEKRRKSLFEASGSREPLHFNVKEEQRIVEEQKAVRELKLMEEQVVIEEQVVEEVMVVEDPAEQVVMENVALDEIMLGNLEEVPLQVIMVNFYVFLSVKICHQGQHVSLMVADVDQHHPDTYTLALL